MSDNPFFRTPMGYRFIETTLPALVRELERLNTNLERVFPLREGRAVEAERESAAEPGEKRRR